MKNQEYRPRELLPLDEVGDVSRDRDVLFTNLILAGLTVWVLFSTVLLNQVLQDNRAEIDSRTAAFTRPIRRLAGSFRGWPWPGVTLPLLVLALTGLLYVLVEPDVGLNARTYILFLSSILGVGLVTYLCSGLESVATERWLRVEAVVRPFPACIAIAAVSVLVSRLVDLQPGVMYGFVASCAVVTPIASTAGQTGRVALVPVMTAVFVAVAAWLLVGPIRALNDDPGGWFPALLEATAIVVFIGGIEGTVISMVPLPETDGGKLLRWRPWIWVLISLVSAFLAWHVLLGRERSYFSGLRQTTSLTVVILFIVYSALTAAVWAYFHFRRDEPAAELAGPRALP